MAAAARERATSSQGPGDLRFTVAGLEHGQARIVEGRRSLEFRFLGTGRNFTAALTGPAGQRLLGRIADDPVNRPWRVVFPETQFRAGERWRIDVSNRFDSGTGFFTVVEGPILPSPEANGFGEDDRAVLGALILAASDVDSWSLEAFQWITGRQARRFGEEDAEYLLWLWSTDPWAVPGQDRGQMR
jgi:hypothetical protein